MVKTLYVIEKTQLLRFNNGFMKHIISLIILSLFFQMGADASELKIKIGSRVRLKAYDVKFNNFDYSGRFWLIGYAISTSKDNLTFTDERRKEIVDIPWKSIKELELSLGGSPYEKHNGSAFRRGFVWGAIISMPIAILLTYFAHEGHKITDDNTDKDSSFSTGKTILVYAGFQSASALVVGVPMGLINMAISTPDKKETWMQIPLPRDMGKSSSSMQYSARFTWLF